MCLIKTNDCFVVVLYRFSTIDGLLALQKASGKCTQKMGLHYRWLYIAVNRYLISNHVLDKIRANLDNNSQYALSPMSKRTAG